MKAKVLKNSDKIYLFHNNRCSKSREVKKYLDELVVIDCEELEIICRRKINILTLNNFRNENCKYCVRIAKLGTFHRVKLYDDNSVG